MQNLKIIVIGAGIGGLTAAIALQKANFIVEVYDRVRELRPVGAGISLWSNGVKVLNRLGLGAEIAQIGGQMDWMEYRWLSGDLLNLIDLSPLVKQVGQRPYPVARADLQRILLNAYQGEVQLESSCIGVEEDETGVTVFFADGRTTRGDMVVAADGIRSVLRAHVLEEKVDPQYAGYVNWNGLVTISDDLAPENAWIIYVGDHKRASMMPVGGQRFYFFFDVPLPKGKSAPDDPKMELMGYFEDWAKPVQNLICKIDQTKTNRLEVHDCGPLTKMVRGRVALLGDAAHATCPDLGQGGCQAMEDGLVLADYLQTTNLDIPYALQRYETDRVDRTTFIVEKARRRAEVIHGKDSEVTQNWYDQLRCESPKEVTDAITKIILGGPLQ